MRSTAVTILFALAVLLATGCSADKPLNPSFAISYRDAKAALKEMKANPKALERPVLVLSGYIDPGIVASQAVKAIRKHTGDDRVLAVSYAFNGSFDECREDVIEKLQATYPSDDPDATIEVDVVAVSMGGLVGRHAAIAPPSPISADRPDSPSPRRRLRIRRMFTISTPHRGANMAGLPTFNGLQKSMRPDSPFLVRLDEALTDADYDMFYYARLDDAVVGEANAAPPGHTAWWVANAPFQGAHLNAHKDPRILTDILRRLRSEQPVTTLPPAPLPEDSTN